MKHKFLVEKIGSGVWTLLLDQNKNEVRLGGPNKDSSLILSTLVGDFNLPSVEVIKIRPAMSGKSVYQFHCNFVTAWEVLTEWKKLFSVKETTTFKGKLWQ